MTIDIFYKCKLYVKANKGAVWCGFKIKNGRIKAVCYNAVIAG